MSSNQGPEPEESMEELLAMTTEQLQAKLKALKIDISLQKKQLASLEEERAFRAKLFEGADAFVSFGNPCKEEQPANVTKLIEDVGAIVNDLTKLNGAFPVSEIKSAERLIEQFRECVYSGLEKEKLEQARKIMAFDDYMKNHHPEHIITKQLQKWREEVESEEKN